MTGDHKHDILGAKENNLSGLKVLYRSVGRKELVEEVDHVISMGMG